ncbi:PREDICTED: uncharacterized protein LOC105994037 [Dipodomys ordii]|uniref:Uncharacterized protein LOC105994037 n=1 Tax=Dipodomys ordii TaxID=10020 RepID=A0A1S3G4D1_DIPOR|nr:PREDICTED: uncharacterized protein LOC105994037 [Dipodomys ordii]
MREAAADTAGAVRGFFFFPILIDCAGNTKGGASSPKGGKRVTARPEVPPLFSALICFHALHRLRSLVRTLVRRSARQRASCLPPGFRSRTLLAVGELIWGGNPSPVAWAALVVPSISAECPQGLALPELRLPGAARRPPPLRPGAAAAATERSRPAPRARREGAVFYAKSKGPLEAGLSRRSVQSSSAESRTRRTNTQDRAPVRQEQRCRPGVSSQEQSTGVPRTPVMLATWLRGFGERPHFLWGLTCLAHIFAHVPSVRPTETKTTSAGSGTPDLLGSDEFVAFAL